MGNVAYTEEYRRRWEACQPLFDAGNHEETECRALSDGYAVRINTYAGKVNDWNLHGSECELLGSDGGVIATWRSIDNDGDFHQIIRHANGKAYLLFRQDLYGYSVLELATGKITQFFPQASLNGGETFIWTGAEYNAASNVLAVPGCYWACPSGAHLFTFDAPLSKNPEYVDLVECLDGGYDAYDDVDFVKWDGSELHITAFDLGTGKRESVMIKQSEYLAWLREKGQEL